MPSGVTADRLREELVTALSQDDRGGRLNSLQNVAVMSYLSNRGFDVNAVDLDDRPDTIEGWVQWADRHSSDS
jgi:hypothetical protein